MKLALTILLAASVQSAKFYDDSAKVVLTIGDQAAKSFDFKFQTKYGDIFVFGPECEKAGVCAKESHKSFDPTKNNGTAGTKGVPFHGVIVDEYKDVAIQLDKTVSKQNILVGRKAAGEIKSFDDDAYFGLRNNRANSAFDELVDTQDEGKKFLLIIPKNPKDSKSEGEVVVGVDDDKACGEFSLQKTEKISDGPSWAVKINITYGENSGRVNVAPSFTEKLVVNGDAKKALLGSKDELTADEYSKLGDLVIKHGNIDIKIPKDQLFEEKNKKYILNAVATDIDDDFDLGLNNNVLKNYCIKFVKESDKYTIALADRKNSVGFVSMSLGLMMGMLAVVRL